MQTKKSDLTLEACLSSSSCILHLLVQVSMLDPP